MDNLTLSHTREQLAYGLWTDRRRSTLGARTLDRERSKGAAETGPEQSYVRTSRGRTAKKRNVAWEAVAGLLDGFYDRYFRACERQFPQLSPMEHRICALVKAQLPNWKIAEMLSISVRTVENHLRNTRRKLGIAPGTRMHHTLAQVRIDSEDDKN